MMITLMRTEGALEAARGPAGGGLTAVQSTAR